MNKVIFLFLLIGFFQSATSQVRENSALIDPQMNPLESFTEQSGQETEDPQWDETLEHFLAHPLNINTEDQDELKSFPFFTELQVRALTEHRKKFGDLIAIEEMQVMDEFNPEFIRKIRPYITVNSGAGQASIQLNNLVTGKQMILLRIQKVLELQRGYAQDNTGSDHYPGTNEKLFLKYRYEIPGRLRFGLTGEKDPGENFFAGNQKYGFDFYSAHLLYTGIGFVRQAILGDYSIQAGQGLSMWSGLNFGKSADPVFIRKNMQGIYPYSSVDENRFMRGAAVSLAWQSLRTDFFYSWHALDANLISSDTMDAISSLQESGYHRTNSEITDRHVVNERIVGGLIRIQRKTFSVGGIIYSTSFSRKLQKEIQPYNQFEFHGNANLNASLFYSLVYRNANLFGEIARSQNGSVAILQGCLVQLHPRLTFAMLIRNYGKSYQSMQSAGFAENSQTANEAGSYMGITLKLQQGFSLNAYLDIFRFPWLKYQVDGPSQGSDFLIQGNWVPRKKFEMHMRFHYKQKEENDVLKGTEPLHVLVPVVHKNLRWSIRSDISDSWIWSARVEWTHWKKADSEAENGYLVYSDFLYHPLKSKFSGSVRFAIFDCKNYEARIYSYENDVLFSNSIPASQGTGIRYYFNLRYQVMKGLDLWLRWARTIYDDVSTIGEGLDQIIGNKKTEVKAQVRFQF